jgi:hypothetical protein
VGNRGHRDVHAVLGTLFPVGFSALMRELSGLFYEPALPLRELLWRNFPFSP